jgi:hypothetical protein
LEEKHLDSYRKNRFNSVEGYVNFVGKEYEEIYEDSTDGRLILVKRNEKANNLILELSPSKDGTLNVISGFPADTNKFNKRVKKGRYKLIWKK